MQNLISAFLFLLGLIMMGNQQDMYFPYVNIVGFFVWTIGIAIVKD